MILILSKSGDSTTNMVMEWLNYCSHPFYRINIQDTMQRPWCININKRTIEIENSIIPIEEIQVVWYRKFGLKLAPFLDKNHVQPVIIDKLSKEYNSAIEAFLFLLKDKKWLTEFNRFKLNKSEILLQANEIGFNIPMTIITNCNNTIYNEIIDGKQMISKTLDDIIMIKSLADTYNMFTHEITPLVLGDLPNRFFPSLCQIKLEKKYEIRAFYLDGEVYAMAQFSQLDNQTKIDTRESNPMKPIRCVPYSFNKDELVLIRKFMHKIGLNCGSLDFIVSKSNVLFFLEVNPVGEIGQMEFNCNYGLFKKIADYLIRNDANFNISINK